MRGRPPKGKAKSQFDLQFTCFIWMQLCTLRISGIVRRIVHRCERGNPVSPQLRIITLSNWNSYVASRSLHTPKCDSCVVPFFFLSPLHFFALARDLDKLIGFRTGSRVLFFHLLFHITTYSRSIVDDQRTRIWSELYGRGIMGLIQKLIEEGISNKILSMVSSAFQQDILLMLVINWKITHI